MLVIEQVTYTNQKISLDDLQQKYPQPKLVQEGTIAAHQESGKAGEEASTKSENEIKEKEKAGTSTDQDVEMQQQGTSETKQQETDEQYKSNIMNKCVEAINAYCSPMGMLNQEQVVTVYQQTA